MERCRSRFWCLVLLLAVLMSGWGAAKHCRAGMNDPVMFLVEGLPRTTPAGVALPLTITTTDVFGNPVTNFQGKAGLRSFQRKAAPTLVVSEIGDDGLTLEFTNPGDTPLPLDGWVIRGWWRIAGSRSNRVFRVPTAGIDIVPPFSVFVAPGGSRELVKPVKESLSMITVHDQLGQLVDEVFLEPRPDPDFWIPPSRWDGMGLALLDLPPDATLQRRGSENAFRMEDWTPAYRSSFWPAVQSSPNIGEVNTGLELPWIGNRQDAPINIATIVFTNGIWKGPVTPLASGNHVSLLVEDDSGRGTESAPFEVTSLRRLRLILPPETSERSEAAAGLPAPASVELPATEDSDILVSLEFSKADEFAGPSQVLIPAGQISGFFSITNLDDPISDGRARVTLRATASGFERAEAVLTNNDDESGEFMLVLPEVTSENTGLAGWGRVILQAPAVRDMEVLLSATGAVSVPPSVVIACGKSTVHFPVTVRDDPCFNREDRRASVTASIPGWTPVSVSIRVTDDETGAFILELPERIAEGETVIGRLRLEHPRDYDVLVRLEANTYRLNLPNTILLTAGSTESEFALELRHDVTTNVSDPGRICVKVGTIRPACVSITLLGDESHPHNEPNVARPLSDRAPLVAEEASHDLHLVAVAAPKRIRTGEAVRVLLSIANDGASSADDVSLRVTNTQWLEFARASGEGPWLPSPSLELLGGLQAGEQREVAVELRATQPGIFAPIFSIAAASLDRDPANNHGISVFAAVADEPTDEEPGEALEWSLPDGVIAWNPVRHVVTLAPAGETSALILMPPGEPHALTWWPLAFQSTTLAIAPDGDHAWLGVATGGIARVDLQTGKVLSRFAIEQDIQPPAATLATVAAARDQVIVAGPDSTGMVSVGLYHGDGTPVGGAVRDLPGSAEGTYIAAISSNRVILSTGEALRELQVDSTGIEETGSADWMAAGGRISIAGKRLFFPFGGAYSLEGIPTPHLLIGSGTAVADPLVDLLYFVDRGWDSDLDGLTLMVLDATSLWRAWAQELVGTVGGEPVRVALPLTASILGRQSLRAKVLSAPPDRGLSEHRVTLECDVVSPPVPPVLVVDDTPVIEGTHLVAVLSEPACTNLDVFFQVEPVSADPNDFYRTNEPFHFNRGERLAFASITRNDLTPEPTETFRLILLEGPVRFAQKITVMEIRDDDLPRLAAPWIEVVEGDDGFRFAELTLQLNAAPVVPVELSYRTGSGSATPNVDFIPVTGRLNFAPGQQIQVLAIPILGDRQFERKEWIRLEFQDVSGAVGVREASISLANDDLLTRPQLVLSLTGLDGPAVSFETLPDVYYRLEVCRDPSDDWKLAEGPLAGTGRTMNLRLPMAAQDSAIFRLRAE